MLSRKPLEVAYGVEDIIVFYDLKGLASIMDNNAGVGKLGKATIAVRCGRVTIEGFRSLL